MEILARPHLVRPRQDGGTVHVHPSGKYVYVANRNDGYVGGHRGPSWITPDPVPVFPGGETNIAVFRAGRAVRRAGAHRPRRLPRAAPAHVRTRSDRAAAGRR
ncbi:MAG TPA: hypothetical protein VHZ03_28025 [Trebonia sp.]|nr:hypothetical protein [Trebonia sp.]